MLHTIRARIALPFVLLVCGLVLGLGIYFSNLLSTTYRSILETELVSQARLAAVALEPFLASAAAPELLDVQARRLDSQIGKRITVVSPDGTVIGESEFDRTAMENHLSRPEVIQARLTGEGVETRFSDTLQLEMMYAAAAIRDEQGEAFGFVRLATPLDDIEKRLARLENTLLIALVLAAGLAVLLAFAIANRTTQPLRHLAQAASQVAQGRMESHLLPTTADEVGQLTVKFNEMTVQLRRQIEALENERSRMAAVLEATADGVLIIDPDGSVSLTNRAAEKMFQIRQNEIAGRSLIEVLRHHEIQELWEDSKRSGESQSVIIELPAQQLYLQCMAIPLGQALPGSSLMLFQNLTRLRRLETVRQDFVSNISHELRTPLASLKALTETLQEGALDDPPAAQRFLGRMLTEVDALSQMVEELLELTRIESGRVPLKLAPVAPLRLIKNAVERLHVQAERAGLEITIDCPDDLPQVQVDARRMEQVIVNLLHNAIKFTPSGGRIWLSARIENDMLRFCVQDSGVGIPTGDLTRIFERFYKTDRARASGGTGLGLAIARHMVEAHGGRIWAESIEGRGSSFLFVLPVGR